MRALSCSLCNLQNFWRYAIIGTRLWVNYKTTSFPNRLCPRNISERFCLKTQWFKRKIQNSPLFVLFIFWFPIYEHNPKYNLLVICLPWSDTFAAFLLFCLSSLFIFYFVWRRMFTAYLAAHCSALVFVEVTNITRYNDTYRSYAIRFSSFFLLTPVILEAAVL